MSSACKINGERWPKGIQENTAIFSFLFKGRFFALRSNSFRLIFKDAMVNVHYRRGNYQISKPSFYCCISKRQSFKTNKKKQKTDYGFNKTLPDPVPWNKKRHFFTKWIWVGCLTIDLHRVARVSWWLIKERRAKVLEIGTGYISRRKDSTINVKNWKELARETNVWRITPLPPQARTRRPIWAQKEPVCVCVTKIDTRENVGLCERVFANRQALLKQTKPKSNMCETATITPHGYGITHFQRQPGKGGGDMSSLERVTITVSVLIVSLTSIRR